MRVDPWWRRPAAEEKPEAARPKKASAGSDRQPEATDAVEAESAAATVDEPTDDSPTALATTAATPATEDATEAEATADAEDAAPAEPAEPAVSAALEAATEPAEPARPVAEETPTAADTPTREDVTVAEGAEGAQAEDAAPAPAKRRRRRRRGGRRSRRGGRGGGQDGGQPSAGGNVTEADPGGAVSPPTRTARPGRAAALLDLGGLERSLEGGPALDPEGLLGRLDGELGKLVLRRVYADASDERLDRKALHGGGVEVVDVPSGTEVRGCSAAVRIVVDALDLCYTKRGVGTVVLGATSVQMLPLVVKLQQNGVTVIGLGGPGGDPQVRAQCDRFIDLSGQA